MKKRFHYKCERCHRAIKTGEECWHKGSPYGRDCYQVIIRIEINAAKYLANSLVPKET